MKIKSLRSSGRRGKPMQKPLATAVAAACSMSAMLVIPQAAAQDALEEIIVTATKRAEGVQDIPMSIMVMDEQKLEDLNITDMADYIQMLPNVSYISIGPATGNIYIRGISSGGESSLGANPSVAVYLDEQPVTAVGEFLNPHIYDVSSIEILAGPQGTTYGANAQAGAMRIITNQPDPSGFSAGFTVDGNQPKSGDIGFLAEGFVNAPLNDRAAIRLVGYYKRDAGYIDNVPSTHTFRRGYIRDGLTDPALIALAADQTIDNYDIAEENFNEATTIGGRAALRIDLNDSWTVTAGVMYQDMESKGVWDHDPTDVGDLQVKRYLPDMYDDQFRMLSLKVEGEIAGGQLTASYGDLDRNQEAEVDYSLYSDHYIAYGYVEPYYSCYVSYLGFCGDSREYISDTGGHDRQTMEIRYVSDSEKRFRWMAGGYSVEYQNAADSDWHVLGLNGTVAAVEAPDVYWTTNFTRSYEETAFFGEASFDISDQVTVSASARRFSYEAMLDGFSGTIWWPCGGFGQDHPDNNYGENCADDNRVTDSSDTVLRFNLEYQINDEMMLYGTWGEGYRPGGLNRFCATRLPDGLGAQGENLATCDFKSDFLTSTEIGLKSTLLDGRMRINVAAFSQEWDNFQFSRLDTTISPITLTYNVGNAESSGIEGDFTVLLTDNWTLSGAASFLNAELVEDYRRNPSSADPDAPAGTPLPRVPEKKFNLASRYNMNNNWYLQGSLVYTGESWNALYGRPGQEYVRGRTLQEAYHIINASVGLDYDDWSAEFYVRNLADERAQVFVNGGSWDQRITTNRPRTFGVSYRRSF